MIQNDLPLPGPGPEKTKCEVTLQVPAALSTLAGEIMARVAELQIPGGEHSVACLHRFLCHGHILVVWRLPYGVTNVWTLVPKSGGPDLSEVGE